MQLIYLTNDLLFSSQVTAMASSLGYQVRTVDTTAQLIEQAKSGESVVIVDLSVKGLDVAATVGGLRGLPCPPAGIIAYAPHVHAEKIAAAQAAGCDQVLTRGQMHSQSAAVLQAYMANF